MRKINLSGRAPARFLSNRVRIDPIFFTFFDRLQITTPKLGIATGAMTTQNNQRDCRYKRIEAKRRKNEVQSAKNDLKVQNWPKK